MLNVCLVLKVRLLGGGEPLRGGAKDKMYRSPGTFKGPKTPLRCLFAFALIFVSFALSFLLSGCEVSSLLCSWPLYGTLQTNEQGVGARAQRVEIALIEGT